MRFLLCNAGHMSSTTHRSELEALATLFSALASPVRLAIIMQLVDGDKCVHQLVDALEQSQPLISRHLRVLREARLVSAIPRGRETAYQIADHHVARIVSDGHQHILEEHPK